MKKSLVFCLIAFTIIPLITSCSGGGSISGNWERDIGVTEHNGKEYTETINISGKSFTNIFYVQETSLVFEPPPPAPTPQTNPNAPPVVRQPPAPPPPDGPIANMNMFRARFNSGDFDKKQVDKYERESSDGRIFEVVITQVTIKGTYSQTGDNIEFVLADNSILVFDISVTENTITLENDKGKLNLIRRR